MSVVKKEGEESYTTNLCQQCYNKSMVAIGDETIDNVAVVRVCGEKDASWKVMENVGKRQYIRDVWEYYCRERSRVKKLREDAENERQAGIQGQWHRQSGSTRSM